MLVPVLRMVWIVSRERAMRQWIAGLTVAGSLVTAPFDGAAAAPVTGSDDFRQATTWAQRLQDDARVLRNGVRSGAVGTILGRQHERLRGDLERLVESHQRWAGSLPSTDRQRIDERLRAIQHGCRLLQAQLDELGRALAAPTPDRQAIRSLGQSIGQQAGHCERALREAARIANSA